MTERNELDESKANLPELTGALEEVTDARAAAKLAAHRHAAKLAANRQKSRAIDAAINRVETFMKDNNYKETLMKFDDQKINAADKIEHKLTKKARALRLDKWKLERETEALKQRRSISHMKGRSSPHIRNKTLEKRVAKWNLEKSIPADLQKGQSHSAKINPERQLRSTSKGTAAVKKSIPTSTSWAKNALEKAGRAAMRKVGRAAMGPQALGASIFLDPTSTGGKKIAFKYSGRKGKYDAKFPPEKGIYSDELTPPNIPSDEELGQIYNKNVADYEKKIQQLKRKKPAVEPVVSLADIYGSDNPGAKRTDKQQANRDANRFLSRRAAAAAAVNKERNKKYLAPTQKDVLPGAKPWSTREKDYTAQAKKQTRLLSKISKNAAYSKLLDDFPELRKSMLARSSVPWKHTPTTAAPHDASMRLPAARDNAKFKAVDQRLPAAKDNAKFKAVDQRLPAAKDNAKFKAVDTARPGEVDFLGQREAAKKKKRSEAIQRWLADWKKNRSLSKK